MSQGCQPATWTLILPISPWPITDHMLQCRWLVWTVELMIVRARREGDGERAGRLSESRPRYHYGPTPDAVGVERSKIIG